MDERGYLRLVMPGQSRKRLYCRKCKAERCLFRPSSWSIPDNEAEVDALACERPLGTRFTILSAEDQASDRWIPLAETEWVTGRSRKVVYTAIYCGSIQSRVETISGPYQRKSFWVRLDEVIARWGCALTDEQLKEIGNV